MASLLKYSYKLTAINQYCLDSPLLSVIFRLTDSSQFRCIILVVCVVVVVVVVVGLGLQCRACGGIVDLGLQVSPFNSFGVFTVTTLPSMLYSQLECVEIWFQS